MNKPKPQSDAERVALLMGCKTVEVRELDRSLHISEHYLYDICLVHDVRQHTGSKCSDCIYSDDCAMNPALRSFLKDYKPKNTETLKWKKNYVGENTL